MKRIAAFAFVSILGIAAVGNAGDEKTEAPEEAAAPSEEKQAWKESGWSWTRGFRKLGGAIASSIRGEEGLKEEWNGVGQGFKGAGTDTAEAVAESIDED